MPNVTIVVDREVLDEVLRAVKDRTHKCVRRQRLARNDGIRMSEQRKLARLDHFTTIVDRQVPERRRVA